MIRPLRMLDLPRLRFVSAQPPAWRLVSDTPAWIAEQDGRIVGWLWAHPGSPACWHIDALQAPADTADQLLDTLIQNSSEKGVTNLTVEIPADDALLELFLAKGFRRYSTLSDYRYGGPVPERPIPCGLRRYRPRDAAALLELHNLCTPSSVRLVDPRTIDDCRLRFFERLTCRQAACFVVVRSQQLLGFLKIVGSSIQVLVHPGGESLYEELFAFALSRLPLPVQTMAPDYQPSKQAALESLGWEKRGTRFLLVKDSLLTIKLSSPTLSVLEDPPFKPAWSSSRFPAKNVSS